VPQKKTAMSVWVVDFKDAYPNIRCILSDDGSIVSFRNFALIFLNRNRRVEKASVSP